ncbi:MAG: hypothetical protein DRN53_05350, partial [Thermoprotei archaeon]
IIENTTIRDYALLVVIGNYEDTSVKVLKLPEKEVIDKYTVGKMEYRITKLPNATFFKVITSRPATVLLMGGAAIDTWPSNKTHKLWPRRRAISMFTTSTNGGYIGKEFIFLATTELPVGRVDIYALEDSKVTIYDRQNRIVKKLEVKANEFKSVFLKSYEIYRVVSTGNIMVQVIDENREPDTLIYPSATGGFIGTRFYGIGVVPEEWLPLEEMAFIVTGIENFKLTVVDLKYKTTILEKEFKAGRLNKLKLESYCIGVESDKPILLMYVGFALSKKVVFLGLRGGEEAYIYVPEGEAYIFSAYEDTIVTVDGVQHYLGRDSYMLLPRGLHRIGADKTVLIEMVKYGNLRTSVFRKIWEFPYTAGFEAFGMIIPPIQGIEKSYDITLKPLRAEFPWKYILILAIVIVAIAVFIIIKRTRKQVK